MKRVQRIKRTRWVKDSPNVSRSKIVKKLAEGARLAEALSAGAITKESHGGYQPRRKDKGSGC